jgi:hypothetical protein
MIADIHIRKSLEGTVVECLPVLQYRDIFSWTKIGVKVTVVCGKDSTQPRAGRYTTMGWSSI